MSRLAKRPIVLPKGVEISLLSEGKVSVKGPKGQLEFIIPQKVTFRVEKEELMVSHEKSEEKGEAELGLAWALIRNGIEGVSAGFEKKLSLIGVGFRAAVQGNKLDLQIGFSHPTHVEIPKGIEVLVDKGTSIAIKGIDKQAVGQFAATVRDLRPPEPYKGKGIRYENEHVRKKAGKAAAKAK